jgi:hypothetical protein
LIGLGSTYRCSGQWILFYSDKPDRIWCITPKHGRASMKRHKSLHPLSHDHHTGLVQARKLREARAGLRPAAERFLEFWLEALQRHFRAEEEILLPAFAQQAGARRPEIAETLAQHVEIRCLADLLQRALEPDLEPGAELLQRLGEALHARIRYEEDRLFPALEQALDEEELARLGLRLAEAR